MPPYPPFRLNLPIHTDEEIKEDPWIADHIAVWKILATAVEAPSIDPPGLAGELDKRFPTKRTDDGYLARREQADNEGFLWVFWEIFAKAASQIPIDDPGQERLVAVIRALRDLPNPIPVPMLNKIWGPLRLWSDLPIMGPAFCEALDVDSGINLEAFFLRLTVSGLLGFEWLGLCALEEALETRPEPRSTAYDKRAALLDAAAPRAALWIQMAGAKLYESCLAEKYRGSTVTTRRGRRARGPLGFRNNGGIRGNADCYKFVETIGPRRRQRIWLGI